MTDRDERGDADAGMDRRRFLGVAGAQAGALWTAGHLAGDEGGRGDEGTKPAPRELRRAPALSRQMPDVAVIGAGAFGAWTALYLQRLGARVVLVDQYGPGNSRATSGGETRGVRSSYGNEPHGLLWARWATEAIRRWQAWDEEHRSDLLPPLFFQTGDLILRDEWAGLLENSARNWDELGIVYERLDMDEVKRRWPVVVTDGLTVATYEPQAGVVRARRAMESVAQVFQQEGGEIRIGRAQLGAREGERMLDMAMEPGDPLVAGQYVLACGPWLPKVLPELMSTRLRTSIGHTVYFGTPPGDNRFTYPNLPSWNFSGVTGWPALGVDNRGFRIRTGGRPPEDPDVSDRRVPPEGYERPFQVALERWPEIALQPVIETRACHYESSVSGNFIIDPLPELSNTWIAGGGSSEAFKSGPVLGEYIAHRVLGDDLEPELAEGFRLLEDEFEPGETWDD